MKWIMAKADNLTRYFNPEYITSVDVKNKLLFTRDTSAGWDLDDEELTRLAKAIGWPLEEEKKNANIQ